MEAKTPLLPLITLMTLASTCILAGPLGYADASRHTEPFFNEGIFLPSRQAPEPNQAFEELINVHGGNLE